MKSLKTVIDTVLSHLCFHPALQPQAPRLSAYLPDALPSYRYIYRVAPTQWGVRETRPRHYVRSLLDDPPTSRREPGISPAQKNLQKERPLRGCFSRMS